MSQSQVRAQVSAFATVPGHNIEFIDSIRRLPPTVQGQLHGVADARQPFSAGCVGPDARERFLLAAKSGNTYRVAVEKGGRAHGWFVSEFALDDNETVIRRKMIEPAAGKNAE
jgi:hypothetical protein